MAALRQDPVTGAWVSIAPRRAERPQPNGEARADNGGDARCPLCAGNEGDTPPEVWRLPDGSGAAWKVRVVPNKYPAATPGEAAAVLPAGLFREVPATGHHEVIVETPEHGVRLRDLSAPQIAAVLDAYHARLDALGREPGVACVTVFKNEGPRAGASQPHAHSQLVAVPVTPAGVAHRVARAREHLRATGRNLYEELLAEERAARVRVVMETAGYVALCPFASAFAYETWIVPVRDQPSYVATTTVERAELAGVLGAILRALARAAGDPDLNYVLHSTSDPATRWHLQILPRTSTLAGLELGAGMIINTVFPEEAARRLREALG